jgi:quinoprotein glucose dehydrogenase
MKKKLFYAIILIVIAPILFIQIKYDAYNKFFYIGNSPKDAIFNLVQIVKKEGVYNTIKKIHNKFSFDERLGFNYSISNKHNYPVIENESDRNLLPSKKTIKKTPIENIKSSLKNNYDDENWFRNNGGNSSRKYSSLKIINSQNVHNLSIAWEFSEITIKENGSLNVQTNPIVVNENIFVASVDHHLLCINAKTGKKIWKKKLPKIIAKRGLVWDENQDFSKSRLFVPTVKGVYAVNPSNGEIIHDFGNDGSIGNQLSLIAPIVTKKSIIIAVTKPAVEAYDIKNGKLLWSRSLIEKEKEKILTGAVPWGGMSFDTLRKKIYVVTGNARPELVGINRRGSNKHSNSLVAINSENGQIEWSFQETAHDLWDFDIPSPPILATITKNGKEIDIVTVVTKIGNTIVLDRDDGNPIYDLDYKLAPTSKIPGEKTAPYQPNFKLPEMFMKDSFEKTDVTNLSLDAEKNILIKIRRSKYGFFEPPMLGGKITVFGVGGGAQWTGAAYNPINKTIFVPSVQVPWQIYLKYVDLKSRSRKIEESVGQQLYQSYCASCHGDKRQGIYSGEKRKGNTSGNDVDFSSPSLVGISFLDDYKNKTKLEVLKNIHKGISKLKNINQKDLTEIYKFFEKTDHEIDKDKSFGYKAFWQELLDNNNCPGSKPPWVYLTAINLESGKISWRKSESIENYFSKKNTCENIPEHGQTLTTAGEILLVIFQKYIYVHEIYNGNILWSDILSEPVTAPPTTYEIDGEQYILIVSSNNFKNHLTAFKLK